MALASGTRLGPYQIVSALGRGGMGEVFKATDTRLGRLVAIKVLPDHVAADPDRKARFHREARALAALSHPHICAIHDVGSHDGIEFLVMEYLEGETLAAALVKGALPLDQSLGYAIQIVDALDKAHRCGITHRDLKPGNIMVTKSGAQLLDFGLARLHTAAADDAAVTGAITVTSPLTGAGNIVGTYRYMAPEQLEGGQADPRSDIFAFGVLLYEMLTGRKAFEGQSQASVIGAILKDEPPPVSMLTPAAPLALDRLVRTCLAKNPDDRWQSAGDLARELRWIKEAASRDVPEGAPLVAPARTVGRTLIVAVAGGLAAVSALAFTAGWLLSGRFSTPPPIVSLSVSPPPGTTFPPGGPWPRVSPDGRQLALVAVSLKGQQQLWVRRLDSTTARPIQGTDGAIRPFWAPDSQSIGFFANGQLRRVDLDTGISRTLVDVPYSGGMSGSWGRDVILFRHIDGIYRVPASGGPRTLAVKDSNDAEALAPSVLPDGRQFLYTALGTRIPQNQACVASLDSDRVSCVASVPSIVTYASPGYIFFVGSGATLQALRFDARSLEVSGGPATVSEDRIDLGQAYLPPASSSGSGVMAYHAGSAGGGRSLAWFDREGRPLNEPRVSGDRPALSPDDRWIVVTREAERSDKGDLWLHDRLRGLETRFTFDPEEDGWPRFSADGDQVVFVSTRGGQSRFYRKRTQGDASETVVADLVGSSPDWSSDGRFMLYQSSSPKTGFDLWAVPLNGEPTPFVAVGTEHGEREGRFSPDARWIAYDSTESGRREVWIQRFPPSGNKWQISTAGGVSPQWRRDGKELFFVDADGMLNAVAITLGPSPQWEQPRPLFRTIYQGGTYASYAITADGQRFLVGAALPADDVAPIVVVTNWTARLPR